MPELHALRARSAVRRCTLLAVLLSGSPALALEVQDCRDAGVGIENIVSAEKGHVALYDGKVDAYDIDTVEPACCSSGIAVTLPAKDDPSGGNNCWAVIGLASVGVKTAKRSYDKAKGLLLVMPTKRGNGDSEPVEGPPLKVRINLGEGTIALE